MSKKETALAINIFENDASKGLEGITKNDLAIPFLSILQSNSPQLLEDKELRPGMIYDTVTKKGYSEILVIPCSYQKQYVEWTPRETGGGLKATYSVSEGLEQLKQCEKNDKGKDILPNGNLLVPTAVYYVMYMEYDSSPIYKAIISMTSTALKKSRRWNSVMAGIIMKGSNGSFTPPSFSHVYKITTCSETNVHGSWFNWDIQLHGPISNESLYNQSKCFASDMSETITTQELPPF